MQCRSEEERLPIANEVDLMQAVMHVGRVAQTIGFDGVDAAKLMTAVSELARNILKFAGSGAILTARLKQHGRFGIEITARDEGPGISDVDRALEDHFSTSGTLGLGLPGVRRMMDNLEINSAPGRGTTVTVRKWLP